MALYHPYCLESDVTGHTKNSDIPTSTIENSINMASRIVEEYTKRLFHYYDFSSTAYKAPNLDFIDGKYIYLPFPVISLSEVKCDGDVIPISNVSFAEKPSNYQTRSVIEITQTVTYDFLSQASETKVVNAEIKGIFGFQALSDSAVPDDIAFPAGIRRACLLAAATFTEFNRKEQVTLDGDRTSIAEYKIPDEAKHILNFHKRKVIV
jgi:hypothetical protein